MKLFFTVSLIALVSSANAYSQSATGIAKLKIIQALSLVNTSDLDFGVLSSGATGQQTVAASDPTAAGFDVTGEANTTYNIVLPSSAITMSANGGGPGNEIDVDSFTSDAAGNTGTLSGTGTDSFNVGGQTTLTGTESTGEYAGNFTVTVSY